MYLDDMLIPICLLYYVLSQTLIAKQFERFICSLNLQHLSIERVVVLQPLLEDFLEQI